MFLETRSAAKWLDLARRSSTNHSTAWGRKESKLFRLHCHPCSVYSIPMERTDTIPTRSSSTIVALQVEMVVSRVLCPVELESA
jgi:hypothetical protein